MRPSDSPQAWLVLLASRGYYWLHDDNPKRPHAELASGLHSPGYFNATGVVEDPDLLVALVRLLVGKILPLRISLSPNTISELRVVGPSYGAPLIAYELARQLGCLCGFTEIEFEGGKKVQRMRRFKIEKDAPVLLAEDVTTTGGTGIEVANVLATLGARVLPIVATLFNRSGLAEVDGRRIVSVFDVPMPTWTPEQCAASELCSKGSQALKPKSHWAELTAAY